MDDALRLLINQFNEVQLKAVAILESEFGCPRPDSNIDFVTRCAPHIRKMGYESGGYRIRPHGYGMEITIDGKTIDFDFGAAGEINGFDAWRLYHFVKSNKIKTHLKSEEAIQDSITKAISSGSIYKSDSLNHYTNS
ncbi:DUF6896 domain-containing protein [Shewanella fidelis]|uniref:DUF6896 domain-containing protein n=1 Tax=Shewanella fidelis TaxID=173509 RepID=UPI0006843386|nr:hypothetical protein [Shewanella fidelis]